MVIVSVKMTVKDIDREIVQRVTCECELPGKNIALAGMFRIIVAPVP